MKIGTGSWASHFTSPRYWRTKPRKLVRVATAAVLAAAGIMVAAAPALATPDPGPNGIPFDSERMVSGSWYQWTTPPGWPGGPVGAMVNTALPNGDMFLGIIYNGGTLRYALRYPGGDWSAWNSTPLPSNCSNQIAAGALPNGQVHVDIVCSSQTVVADNVLFTTGGWQGWRDISQVPGQLIGSIAEAGLPNGTLHVDVTSVYGNTRVLFDNQRNADGSWSGWAAPALPPGGVDNDPITDAILPNGNLHVDVLAGANGDTIYDNVRYPNGAWQGWFPPPQPPIPSTGGSITNLKSAGMPDGSMQFVAIVTQNNSLTTLYHTIRLASGGWYNWNETNQNGGWYMNNLAIAGLADGTSHVDISQWNPG